MKKLLLIPSILILLTPLAAWAIYKPVRVLAPEWVESVTCVSSVICIDDETRYSEASELYENALGFIARAVGPFQNKPRVIFCTTETSFQSFGFNRASASTVGKSGIIISPRGWKSHYISHEMIHYRQAEELGTLASLLEPEWFIEGMAYSLSDDPRQQLSEPWEQHRVKFNAWFNKVDKERLWLDAKKL